MDQGSREPELTPRAKLAQVAPEATLTHRTPRRSGPGGIPTLAPPEAAADEVQRKVAYGGRAAVKASLLLYLKLLLPITVVSIWMFSIFAVFSWIVPNRLCHAAAVELSGSTVGLSKCMYVVGGGYTPYSGTKVFWLLYWSVQAAWMTVFPGIVCKAIFGSCMSRVQVATTLVCGAGCFVAPMVTAIRYDMALNNYVVLVCSAVGSLTVTCTCSAAAVRYTGNKLMRWRWIALFVLAGQVNSFYLWIMPHVITGRSQQALGGMGLTLVRIFVHPVIWAGVLFFFRTVMRHIGRVKDLTQTCFYVWPLLYSSLYGRFLLLQLDNVGSVVIMNFMFACFTIAANLADRGNDRMWLGWIYGDRAADAMQSVLDVDEFALVDNLAGTMIESASILCCAALLSFGRVAARPGVPPDNALVWYNAFAQLTTTLVFDFVNVVASGKFHNLEWGRVYPRSVRRFLGYVMLVLTIGGGRVCLELLLLYCPKVYDGAGLLLEECDRPSIFQAVSFTFANRARGTAVGNFLDIGPANATAGGLNA